MKFKFFQKFAPVTHKVVKFVEKRPVISVGMVLAVFVLLIVIGNFLRRPQVKTTQNQLKKSVSIYKVGSAPRMSFQAQVEKTGVVEIVAQTGGVVSKINVTEGKKISRGTTLLSLSSTYAGGNAMSLSRQIAQKQFDYTESVYPTQKDLINRQRDMANQSLTNFEKMREITNQSVSDTQNIIDLNNSIISTLETNIQNLSVDPVGNATLILTSKQMASQFKSANSQLSSALRGAQYQVDTNNPPTKLAEDQKAIALGQLEIQEKSLDLNKDITGLQLKLARINESLMYPSSPFAGTVERVLVRPGQSVGPGTPLFVISGTKNTQLNAIVYLPQEVAASVSRLEPASFIIGGKTINATPSYISREAVNGNLYAAVYRLPEADYSSVSDKEYVTASLPIGYPDTNSVMPYLPLDTVYQTQEDAYIFVNDNGTARSKKITLGNVMGNFVQIKSGLLNGDQVIEDRSVIDGQLIETK